MKVYMVRVDACCEVESCVEDEGDGNHVREQRPSGPRDGAKTVVISVQRVFVRRSQ